MPTTHLAAIDWVIIGSYFLALLGIGLYYRRFAGRSLEDYFLSGRRNSGWANGVSYAAAMMNADVAPAYSGLTVATGLFICWWYLTRFGPALFIGAILFAVFWRRLNLFTTPEFYELRFGGLAGNVIRTWVAVRASLIAMVAWTGTGLLAMHKIAGPVLGISKTNTLLIVIPIVLVYVGVAGFSGVVATAGVQSLIMVVGSVMLCGIVLYSMGGPVELAERLQQVGGSEVLNAFPPSEHAVFPLAAAMVYLVGSSLGYGGDTAPLGGAMEGQYVLSSKSTREASKMYIVAEITLFVLLLLVTLPSLGALVEWPELRGGKVDREMAYGLLMARYLPPGMLGLLFVVMLAAVMSTIGSNLNFGAQVLVNDVYRRHLRPQETDRHYVWAGRIATLLILGLALLVVYNVSLIFEVAIFMLTFSAAELPANWAQWWWWRFNQWGRLAASFGAPVILLLVRGFSVPGLPAFPGICSDWPWWDQAYLVIGLNTVLWVAVTLATPADSPAILERFYRKGRPLGAWGPVRRRVQGGRPELVGVGAASSSGSGLILTGLLLALLGSGSIMLMVQGLSHLYVARYVSAAWELTGFVVGGVVFLKSYGRYLGRLDAWTGVREEAAALETAGGLPVIANVEHGSPAEADGPTAVEDAVQPLPTSVVVAWVTLGYGLLLAALGLTWTTGADLAFNLLAAGSFVVSAGLVWRLGRPAGETPAPRAAPHAKQTDTHPGSITYAQRAAGFSPRGPAKSENARD